MTGFEMLASEPTPLALLLHDGELADVRMLLGDLGAEIHEPAEAESGSGGPWDLVVVTSKRVLELTHELPGTESNRIAVVDTDSRTLRAMLRRVGVQRVVRRPVHAAAMRLLLLHVLYSGPEKRAASRVPVGVPVRFRTRWRRRSALLADLSGSGGRLVARRGHRLERGARLRIRFPASLCGRAFSAVASILRVQAADHDAIAVRFERLSSSAKRRLTAAVAAHHEGPAVFPGASGPSGRARSSSPATIDLTRDANEESSDPDTDTDRRSSLRHELRRHIIALSEQATRVVLGRDISLGGMRIQPHASLVLGDEMQLALHVRAHEDPLVVGARVERDDGDDGLLLRFRDLDLTAAGCLEEMLSALPPLAESEPPDLVVSEILPSHDD